MSLRDCTYNDSIKETHESNLIYLKNDTLLNKHCTKSKVNQLAAVLL